MPSSMVLSRRAACLQPGGAGVPFYIGNAQCGSCKGLGFKPCPACVGYEAVLPPPDPFNGPAYHDASDSLVTTRRWLSGFPDSRSTPKSKRYAKLAAWPARSRQYIMYIAGVADWKGTLPNLLAGYRGRCCLRGTGFQPAMNRRQILALPWRRSQIGRRLQSSSMSCTDQSAGLLKGTSRQSRATQLG